MNTLEENIDKIHTTLLGYQRIQRNLDLCYDNDATLEWCNIKIKEAQSYKLVGKNWYAYSDRAVFTIHSKSYTLITAHTTT